MEDKRNKEVITIIISVIVIILVVYLGISPAVAILKKSNYTIATKGKDLDNAEENLNNVKNLQSAINSNSNTIKSLLSALPSFADSEDLITTLEAIASKNGMQMAGVTPLDTFYIGMEEEGTTTEGISVQEANYDIIIRGPYTGLQSFMTDIENNRRPINVTKLNISKETSEGGAITLNNTISITAYYSQISSQ